jgi:TldD protein
VRELGKSLEALRKAPVTEPFDGPAILSGRAAAVFFHEVLGHRLEGQRQRGDEEGQTFTKEVGKEVLPTFLSVADDPTRDKFGGDLAERQLRIRRRGPEGAARGPDRRRRAEDLPDVAAAHRQLSQLERPRPRADRAHVPTGRQGNLIVTSTKDRAGGRAAQAVDRGSEEAGQAVRALLRGHFFGLCGHHAQFAAGLSGDSAGGLARVCGWPAG